MTFTRKQIVTYVARNGRGMTVQAHIHRCHRDGSYTVEARHFLDAAGKIVPCYLGYRYRLHASDLRAAA